TSVLSTAVGAGRRRLPPADSGWLESCSSGVRDMLAIGMQWVDTSMATCELNIDEFCDFLDGLGEDYEVICEEKGEWRIMQSGRLELETLQSSNGEVTTSTDEKLTVLGEAHPAREIVVAVVDAGVEYDHPDLISNIFSYPHRHHSHDFYDDDLDRLALAIFVRICPARQWRPPHKAGVAVLFSGLGVSPADINQVLSALADPVYYF
ncbi:Suppressor of the cold-sensitive snRNP bioproteinsis mutant brr1-1, partial [Perkinsus olseni]